MIKNAKLGIKGNFLNLIKGIYKNPTANITLGSGKLKFSPSDQLLISMIARS